jgi:hypothetical protein
VTYSAFWVDKAIVVCNLDVHTKGQLASMMTYPVLLFALTGSFGSSIPNRPPNSASTKQST